MLERNRIIKQEGQINQFNINGIYALRNYEKYANEVLEIINRLYLENPNCFDINVIEHKMCLANMLVKKYHKDINNYYHYTIRNENSIIGIRYKSINDPTVTRAINYFRDKVVLLVVKYEMENNYLNELKSLVTYDLLTKEVKVSNITFSETLNNELYVYYWSRNNKKSNNKVFAKTFNN